MKNKFSKKDLEKMIFSKTTNLSKEEIKLLIDKELSKEPENIDTDYIDLCFELMSINDEQKGTVVPIKSFRMKKSMMVAAAVMFIFVSMMSVSAFYFNIPQKVAELVNGNAEIDFDLENADTTADGYKLLETDLAKELESFGITPVTFPEAMVRKECEISKIENATINETISFEAYIIFKYNGFLGRMRIDQKTPYEEISGVRAVMDVEAGEMININGMDILVFEQEKNCTITYRDNLTDYTIYLECDFETAKKFAKTIK